MSHPDRHTQLEHQRLLSVAREYRRKGYRVKLYPSAQELPPLLADCSIDLVAEAEDQVVAVEVRTRDRLTLNGSADLRRITDRVHQLPGWEFELVVTNPRRRTA